MRKFRKSLRLAEGRPATRILRKRIEASKLEGCCYLSAARRRRSRAAALAAVLTAALAAPGTNSVGLPMKAPAVVSLQPRPFYYRPAGQFTRDGELVNAPVRIARLNRALAIMTNQVKAADYRRCVLDCACPLVLAGADTSDPPAVKISWHDASAYAARLSRQLGVTYRLPNDEEWAFAAGSRFRDDAFDEGATDPAQRWLQQYEREAERDDSLDSAPRSIGSFGVNENGLFDFAGNVWEWTNTCFIHQAVNALGPGTAIANCGVRVVEGRHRTYMTDFIRDPRIGGCALGKPPTNLGFRLVRESTLP